MSGVHIEFMARLVQSLKVWKYCSGVVLDHGFLDFVLRLVQGRWLVRMVKQPLFGHVKVLNGARFWIEMLHVRVFQVQLLEVSPSVLADFPSGFVEVVDLSPLALCLFRPVSP